MNHIPIYDAMLASNNPLRFRKKILIYNKIMTTDDQIRDKKTTIRY